MIWDLWFWTLLLCCYLSGGLVVDVGWWLSIRRRYR